MSVAPAIGKLSCTTMVEAVLGPEFFNHITYLTVPFNAGRELLIFLRSDKSTDLIVWADSPKTVKSTNKIVVANPLKDEFSECLLSLSSAL